MAACWLQRLGVLVAGANAFKMEINANQIGHPLVQGTNTLTYRSFTTINDIQYTIQPFLGSKLQMISFILATAKETTYVEGSACNSGNICHNNVFVQASSTTFQNGIVSSTAGFTQQLSTPSKPAVTITANGVIAKD